MSMFTSDAPAEPRPEQPAGSVTTAYTTEDKPSQSSEHEDKSSSDKRSIDNSPFNHQFSEVEKAIANFTKHQPFNHHYAPNVNVNNNRHHPNNNHHHYNNRGNNHNNHHHNNYNHNNHYNNGNNNGSRLQPQSFTMNAQLKQQQQQQFLSSAAQQINNRYKSNNGSINPMVNVNGMPVNQVPQMSQLNGMSNMSGMNHMVNSVNINGMSNMANAMPSQGPQQTQGYMSHQYHHQSMIQQQMPQQQQTMPSGNGFMSNDLKFDSFSQQSQPQLTHSDYITPLRNVSPQFPAPTRPVSVSAFGSPLEQINSNSSFGLNGGEMQSPMTNASSNGVVDGDYNKKLSLGDSTYLGDIWGSGKGLRNSTSVWA